MTDLNEFIYEDADSPEGRESLRRMVKALRMRETPPVDPTQTDDLIAVLQAEMPTCRQRWRNRLLAWWPLLVLRGQVRVIYGELWLASALVMALGLLVTLGMFGGASGDVMIFALLAPLVSAAGIGLLYDSDTAHHMEIEAATPASTRLILLARLVLVFSFNLGLSLTGSVVLSIAHTEVSLWLLVLSWLGPMAFLSALAFFLSVYFAEALVGEVVALGLWILHIALRASPVENGLSLVFSLPGLGAVSMVPSMLLAALVMIVAGLWVSGLQTVGGVDFDRA